MEIHLDTSHSHRGKYAFFTNPLGTRADANEGPSGVFNYGWTVDWRCEARIESNRWCFEMKIPFATMNYDRRNGQHWGFNVTRMLRRTDCTTFWSFNPTDTYKPRNFGHLEGLDLADKMWIKGSIQPQDSDFHNASIIYGWEFLRRKHFYFAFNSVNDGSGTVNSLFSKVTYTF